MAFPFILQENFEKGTAAPTFDFDQDNLGRLTFPDHNEHLTIPPWRGGYVMKVDCDRGVEAAYIQAPISIAAGTTRYFLVRIRLSEDFWMAPGTSLEFMRLTSGGASPTTEVGSRLHVTPS